MTDLAIRAVSIAESAQRAARMAADTLTHQPNPFEAGTSEHERWEVAYAKWHEHFMTGDFE